VRIVLLGHDDLPSLYALQRVIEGAPQHRYAAFFSGDLPHPRETPRDLAELASIDARLCARLRKSGRLAAPLLEAGNLSQPNAAAGRMALEAGKAPETTAQTPGGTYFSTPERADVEKFAARGLELADGRELAEINA
jgi:hypothetical protein